MESIIGFTKRIPSLVSRIASIIFNDPIRMGQYIYWPVDEICRVGEYWLKNSENWVVQVMLSWTNLYLYWPHTFIIHPTMYQMCLPNQSSVLNVILKHDCIVFYPTHFIQLISSLLEINLSLLTIKAYFFCNLYYLIMIHFVSFILYQV